LPRPWPQLPRRDGSHSAFFGPWVAEPATLRPEPSAPGVDVSRPRGQPAARRRSLMRRPVLRRGRGPRWSQEEVGNGRFIGRRRRRAAKVTGRWLVTRYGPAPCPSSTSARRPGRRRARGHLSAGQRPRRSPDEHGHGPCGPDGHQTLRPAQADEPLVSALLGPELVRRRARRAEGVAGRWPAGSGIW
jgi:hypothetical protein